MFATSATASGKCHWLHVLLKGDELQTALKKFEVWGLPKTILVNENGIIIAVDNELRRENLDKTLAQFLDVANK